MLTNFGSSIDPNNVSRNRSPLFSSVSANAAAALGQTVTFFSTARGASGSGPEITNLPVPFQIQAGDRFTVYALRFVFIGCGKADIEGVFKNYTAQFIIANAPLLDAPCENWPGGGGIFGATNETSGFVYTNGSPTPQAIMPLPEDAKAVINGGDTFKVQLIGTSYTTVAAMFIRCYLDGIRESALRG